MKPIRFPGYGPNAPEKVIDLNRVYMWSGVDYNGIHGTEVYIDGANHPVLLGVYEWDFTKVMRSEIPGAE